MTFLHRDVKKLRNDYLPMTFFLPQALLQKRSNSDKASRVFVYINQEVSDQIKAINNSIKQQLGPKR